MLSYSCPTLLYNNFFRRMNTTLSGWYKVPSIVRPSRSYLSKNIWVGWSKVAFEPAVRALEKQTCNIHTKYFHVFQRCLLLQKKLQMTTEPNLYKENGTSINFEDFSRWLNWNYYSLYHYSYRQSDIEWLLVTINLLLGWHPIQLAISAQYLTWKTWIFLLSLTESFANTGVWHSISVVLGSFILP